MKQKTDFQKHYLDSSVKMDKKLEQHCYEAARFQDKPVEFLVSVAISNLCVTYGSETVMKAISMQTGMLMPKKTKKSA